MNRDILMAQRIAQEVEKAGGRVYYVGGFVRDMVMGRECKDVDIEVHGLTPAQLETVLDRLGERNTKGASFGVYGLRHYDLDIAMPRTEAQTGRGHKDFACFVDPHLGTKKAAERRDFTLNALMQDVLSGEVIDHFGGLADLDAGIIRHVNDKTFCEDPLRVLRAAQFAARFGFQVAEETRIICSQMDLSSLAGERIMEELNKALTKSEKPSVFFQVLRSMNQLQTWFPEVAALIGVEQEEKFHPEGDVFNHTMQVLDHAASFRGNAVNPRGLMLAALCHDFGKPAATRVIDGRIRAFDHEKLGIPAATAFIQRMSKEVQLKKYISNMILLHMRPNALVRMGSGRKSYMKLLDASIEPADLLLLAKADHMGRGERGKDDYGPLEVKLQEALKTYQNLMEQPAVTGNDLIKAGLQPGKPLGEALDYAHKLHLSGVEHRTALLQTLDYIRKKDMQ